MVRYFLDTRQLQASVQLRVHSMIRLHEVGGNFLYRGFERFAEILDGVEPFLDSFKTIPNILLHLSSPC